MSAEEAIRVKVHVWPRVLGISTRRRVSACGPRRVESADRRRLKVGV